MQVTPFLQKETLRAEDTGNETYEGFIKDILDALGWPYRLVIQQNYGSKEGGKWIGAIGDVVNNVSIQSQCWGCELYHILY